MISFARAFLDLAKAGGENLRRGLEDWPRIPAYQREIYHEQLAPYCPSRLNPPQPEPQANTLRIEVLGLLHRCINRPPSNWGPSAPSGLRWLASGGHIAVFGLCCKAGCPLIKEASPC